MAIERFYVTNVGNNYLALAHGGKKLVINRCAIGTGFLESGQSSVSRTAMVSYLCDMPISGSSVSGSALNVKVQFSNALPSGDIRDPFLWAEVGLYGYIDGDTSHPEALLCYANAYDAEHADYIPGTLSEFVFVMTLSSINPSDDVAVVVNHSLIYATKPTDAVVSLASTGWTGETAPYTQTVTVTGVSTDSMLEVGISDTATDEQYEQARDAQLRATAAGTGSVTIKAYGDKPTTAIPVLVRRFD